MLADFFKARVQVPDVGHRIDDAFAVEFQHEAQRRVRRRVLRAKVQRPQIVLDFVVAISRV